MLKLAFVIATKDRPNDVKTLLKNLSDQSAYHCQVVIVDASTEPVDAVVDGFNDIHITYIRYTDEPSASAQRNAGIRAVDSGMDLIGFLDDDCVFEDGALEKMLMFWNEAPTDVGGCSFNLRNPAPSGNRGLRCNRFTRWLGIYSDIPGVVTPAGWGTLTGLVKHDLEVQWLPSTAVVWRREVFDQIAFEEFFTGYSYLEDLDFSFSAYQSYRLLILADAGFYHYHSVSGRASRYNFGKVEVLNRLFIVKKHHLSQSKCYLALGIRLLLTCFAAVKSMDRSEAQRLLGNIAGLIKSFLPKKECG